MFPSGKRVLSATLELSIFGEVPSNIFTEPGVPFGVVSSNQTEPTAEYQSLHCSPFPGKFTRSMEILRDPLPSGHGLAFVLSKVIFCAFLRTISDCVVGLRLSELLVKSVVTELFSIEFVVVSLVIR